MSTQTVQKVDLSKEDYVLKGLIVSDVSEFDRSQQNKVNLVFVKFVGSKMFGASPSFLYFGDMTFQELNTYRGQKVNVLLSPGEKGFTVQTVQLAIN